MIYQHAYEIFHDDVFLDLSGFINGSDVYLKIEGSNPAGSIKIKAAISMIRQAEMHGCLVAGGSVIESSSGNLGIALSMICASKNYRLTIVTDSNASYSSIRAMQALGTNVIVISEPDKYGGFLHLRIDLIHRMLAEDAKLVWLNQYANLANPMAHRDRTARSIHKELGDVDLLVIGVGTSGTLMGCIEYRKLYGTPRKIVAVDAEGSVTFGGPPGRRRIPGLGTSRRPEIFSDSGEFEKLMVSEWETVSMCRLVASKYGILIGGSTGTVLAGLRQIGERCHPGSKMVAISPDLGEKYLDTVYSEKWVCDNITSKVNEGMKHLVSHDV